ncbi:MAG TPA: anthranilate phosphoribosyltransferase [Microbacteriaceae bacterium]|nr:anthranilate phosphoribosyltransferase [Microbacteriaceae bacterium]
MRPDTTWPAVLTTLAAGQDLTIGQADWAMGEVMRGAASGAQIGALLLGLRAKGETVDEIVGFRDAALRSATALEVPSRVLDIVGTGGDALGGILNISSVASIIAAAAGVPVVKHGNRAASSSSGASDVLSELGVDIQLPPERVAEVFTQTGIAFANAAVLHQGFRHAGGPRRELGIPTLFNILGPLCNPARPEASAVGVADLESVPLIVGVFQTRGATALVYRGDGGIDKMTTTGHTRLWEVSSGSVREHDIDPTELGIPLAPPEAILGRDPAYNAAAIRAILAGESGPHRDIALLNAAAGIVAHRLAEDPGEWDVPIRERLRAQLITAADAVDSGAAAATLTAWATATG